MTNLLLPTNALSIAFDPVHIGAVGPLAIIVVLIMVVTYFLGRRLWLG